MSETHESGAGTVHRDRRPTTPNTCGGCDATWTAPTAAHCGCCHHTFASVRLFDDHRSATGEHGACIDPETIRHGKTGERLMFFRHGMWRGPEMTPEQKAAAFGKRDVA